MREEREGWTLMKKMEGKHCEGRERRLDTMMEEENGRTP